MIWYKRNIFYVIFWVFHVFAQENDITKSCECVPFYLCNNGSINTNGEGIIDIRIQQEDCPDYLETCCGKNAIIEKSATTSSSVQKNAGCGYRNSDGVGYRIIGDVNNEAQFGEFPWVVAILMNNSYMCVGSLIHPQVVLTAAHCVNNNEKFSIRAGEWDSKTTQEIFAHKDITVSSIKIHEGFKTKKLYNDIALLFLESPVTLTSHINVACLPSQNSSASSNECFANGWGKNDFGKSGVYQNILKKVQLPVLSFDQCQSDFRKTRLGKHFKLHESFMCAGGEEGKDVCTGDGGGPLVCPIEGQENRYKQIGIVSWGLGCGDKGVPGAYVDVAHFRNWIDTELGKRNLNISTYQY